MSCLLSTLNKISYLPLTESDPTHILTSQSFIDIEYSHLTTCTNKSIKYFPNGFPLTAPAGSKPSSATQAACSHATVWMCTHPHAHAQASRHGTMHHSFVDGILNCCPVTRDSMGHQNKESKQQGKMVSGIPRWSQLFNPPPPDETFRVRVPPFLSTIISNHIGKFQLHHISTQQFPHNSGIPQALCSNTHKVFLLQMLRIKSIYISKEVRPPS